jgi:hypothetical protein
MTADLQTYAAELMAANRLGHFGWSLQLRSTLSPQESLAQVNASLEALGETRSLDEITQDLDPAGPSDPFARSFSDRLRILSKEFERDLLNAHSQSHRALSMSTKILFLPVRDAAAFCLNTDERGERLTGHLICVHEGLYFSAQMLAKSLVFENLGGDYQQYRQSGRDAFERAADFYIRPQAMLLNEIFFNGLPPEVQGALMAMQSKVAVMILQFVMDHEFGHIAQGHLAVQHFNRCYITPQAGASVLEVKPAYNAYWAMELAADEFALRSLLRNSSSPTSACANFITVAWFFLWLEHLEARMGINVFKTHPPAKFRLEALEEIVSESVPEWPTMSEALGFLKEQIQTWSTTRD